MLNKVLKYDLKFIYKVLLIFYILNLFFAVLTRIFWHYNNLAIFNILGYIASGVTISFIFNILINNIMRVWVRFVKNVYSDESYLTHTLPISKSTIYTSKFLSSIITMFTSILVIIFSLFIAYYSKENFEILKNSLQFLATIYNSSAIKLLLIVFFVIFLEMIFILQAGFTGIIIGHKSNNGKILNSIIYGFLNYILVSGVLLLLVYIIGLFNSDIMNLFITNNIANVNVLKNIMYICTIFYTLLIVIYFIIDIKLFKKGVNVD